MSILSNFEDKISGLFEGAAGSLFRSPVEPVQIVRAAEKEMVKNKLVGPGKTYAPTLYTVLLSPDDDANLSSFYPTLSSECGTYLVGKANEEGLSLTSKPFVRFMVDNGLKGGKFSVIAESVSAEELAEIRDEEEEFWGVAPEPPSPQPVVPMAPPVRQRPAAAPAPYAPPPVAAAPVGGGIPGIDFEDFDYREPQAAPPPTAPLAENYDAPLQATLIDLKSGRQHPLSAMTTVGRDPGNTLVVEDVNVSRNHATVQRQGVSWIVTDLGSTNGTQVGGRKITTTQLHDGDEVTFGVTRFEFAEG